MACHVLFVFTFVSHFVRLCDLSTRAIMHAYGVYATKDGSMKRVLKAIGFILVVSLLLIQGLAQEENPIIPQSANNPFQTLMLNLRNDLEALADRVYGGGQRPPGWTGNADVNASTIIADIWFDHELIADAVFTVGVRPPDWISATTSDTELLLRNIRHDIELASDTFIGLNLRPDGWIGAEPFHRCSRTIMNLLYLLRIFYSQTSSVSPATNNYCEAVGFEIEDVLARDIETGANPEEIPTQVLAVRGDLERLADEKLGLNNRPPDWTFNKDVNSPTLAADNFADMERLSDALLGPGLRPDGWVAAIGDDPGDTARDLRYDLEILADVTLGEGIRPRGWQGTDQIESCRPQVQILVAIVTERYQFLPDASVLSAPNFCEALEIAANNAAENPPVSDIEGLTPEDERYMGESNYAFAYLDAAATQYMGIMPAGVKFRAWYRNFSGSTMMFVSGENFALFIDRHWTTMSERTFNTLPTLEGTLPLTFCDANWCNGPSPTPTPTGSGPLLEILQDTTPVPIITPGVNQQNGKQLVSWNHIRVTYVQQSATVGSAQVALEICTDTSQTTCEPILSVFNLQTGLAVPPITQQNGLNVYELPYGYSTNLLLEGTTLFSNDIWLNDPSL